MSDLARLQAAAADRTADLDRLYFLVDDQLDYLAQVEELEDLETDGLECVGNPHGPDAV